MESNAFAENVKAPGGTNVFITTLCCFLQFYNSFAYLLAPLFLFLFLTCFFLIKPCLSLSITSAIESWSFLISCSRDWILKSKGTAMLVREMYTRLSRRGRTCLMIPPLNLKDQMFFPLSTLHRCSPTSTNLSLLGTVSPLSVEMGCVTLCWA